MNRNTAGVDADKHDKHKTYGLLFMPPASRSRGGGGGGGGGGQIASVLSVRPFVTHTIILRTVHARALVLNFPFDFISKN